MTEQQLQTWIVRRVRADTDWLIFAVPNEGRRSMARARKMVDAGLLSGVSDLIVIIGNRVEFWEVKTPRGRQSATQRLFEDDVVSRGLVYRLLRQPGDLEQIYKEQGL